MNGHEKHQPGAATLKREIGELVAAQRRDTRSLERLAQVRSLREGGDEADAAAAPVHLQEPGEEEGISELRRQIEELQSAVLDYQQRFIELRRENVRIRSEADELRLERDEALAAAQRKPPPLVALSATKIAALQRGLAAAPKPQQPQPAGSDALEGTLPPLVVLPRVASSAPASLSAPAPAPAPAPAQPSQLQQPAAAEASAPSSRASSVASSVPPLRHYAPGLREGLALPGDTMTSAASSVAPVQWEDEDADEQPGSLRGDQQRAAAAAAATSAAAGAAASPSKAAAQGGGGAPQPAELIKQLLGNNPFAPRPKPAASAPAKPPAAAAPASAPASAPAPAPAPALAPAAPAAVAAAAPPRAQAASLAGEGAAEEAAAAARREQEERDRQLALELQAEFQRELEASRTSSQQHASRQYAQKLQRQGLAAEPRAIADNASALSRSPSQRAILEQQLAAERERAAAARRKVEEAEADLKSDRTQRLLRMMSKHKPAE